jgi:hypothetical protein
MVALYTIDHPDRVDRLMQSWVDASERVFTAIDRFLSGEWPPDAVSVRPRALTRYAE